LQKWQSKGCKREEYAGSITERLLFVGTCCCWGVGDFVHRGSDGCWFKRDSGDEGKIIHESRKIGLTKRGGFFHVIDHFIARQTAITVPLKKGKK